MKTASVVDYCLLPVLTHEESTHQNVSSGSPLSWVSSPSLCVHMYISILGFSYTHT